MDNLSSIVEMVLNMHGELDISKIVNERNMCELDFVKQLLVIRTNPDYEVGMDEQTDAILEENPLSTDFLRGLKVGILMSLASEPVIIPSPHRKVLAEMFTMADAILLELCIESD